MLHRARIEGLTRLCVPHLIARFFLQNAIRVGGVIGMHEQIEIPIAAGSQVAAIDIMAGGKALNQQRFNAAFRQDTLEPVGLLNVQGVGSSKFLADGRDFGGNWFGKGQLVSGVVCAIIRKDFPGLAVFVFLRAEGVLKARPVRVGNLRKAAEEILFRMRQFRQKVHGFPSL